MVEKTCTPAPDLPFKVQIRNRISHKRNEKQIDNPMQPWGRKAAVRKRTITKQMPMDPL